jgi:hypothetical protein
MMSKLLLLICLIFSSMAQAKVDYSVYFKRLNYFTGDITKLLAYEREIKADIDEVLAQKLTGAEAVKTIVYGSLFLTNTQQAVRFGKIEGNLYINNLKLGSGDVRSELEHREFYILEALKYGAQLAPSDYRVKAWILTHKMYLENLQTGSVSHNLFDQMLELAKQNIFSYTALGIIANELNLDDEQFSKLFALVDLVKHKIIGCEQKDKKRCGNSKVAPNTRNVGKLITADLYLKQASMEAQLETGAERINPGVSAMVLYKQLRKSNLFIGKLKWKRFAKLKKRTKLAKDLLWRQVPAISKLKEDKFKQAYSCQSCHLKSF